MVIYDIFPIINLVLIELNQNILVRFNSMVGDFWVRFVFLVTERLLVNSVSYSIYIRHATLYLRTGKQWLYIRWVNKFVNLFGGVFMMLMYTWLDSVWLSDPDLLKKKVPCRSRSNDYEKDTHKEGLKHV